MKKIMLLSALCLVAACSSTSETANTTASSATDAAPAKKVLTAQQKCEIFKSKGVAKFAKYCPKGDKSNEK